MSTPSSGIRFCGSSRQPVVARSFVSWNQSVVPSLLLSFCLILSWPDKTLSSPSSLRLWWQIGRSKFHPFAIRRCAFGSWSRRTQQEAKHVRQRRRRGSTFVSTTQIASNHWYLHTFILSHSLVSESDDSWTDDDIARWEAMYEQGSTRAKQIPISDRSRATDSMVDRFSSSTGTSSFYKGTQGGTPIRVISFDLDNTLWNTTETIQAANNALAEFLNHRQIAQPVRVERIMAILFQHNKTRYCPVEQEKAKAPTMLTLLRKDAIQKLMMDYNNMTHDDAVVFADEAFDIWMRARVEAIPKHFATSVLSCLEEIVSSLTTNTRTTTMTRSINAVSPTNGDGDTNFESTQRMMMPSSNVLIGAITDGNSDPRLVPDLAPFFDFCVNAEMVGIGKPDKRVYLHAVRTVLQMKMNQTTVAATATSSSSSSSSSLQEEEDDHDKSRTTAAAAVHEIEHLQLLDSAANDEELQDAIGPWWVHIGDDFVKDVVAAKTLNMRSIWMRELIQNSSQQDGADDVHIRMSTNSLSSENKSSAPLGTSSNRSVEDLIQQVSAQGLVRMQVGSKDYLADALQQEFADAVADRFVDLSSILQQWHREGLALIQTRTEEMTTMGSQAVAGEVTISTRDNPVATAQNVQHEVMFCVYCGHKLIRLAKFCSSCGKKTDYN